MMGLLGGAVLMTSCTVGPDYKSPNAKVSEEWLADPGIAGRASGAAEKYWWRNFNDPVLDRLVEVALNGNLPLQEAGVRILEARASLNKSAGDLFPQQQGVSGQVGQSTQPSKISGKSADYTSAQTLFAASWEIDLWGKYRRQIESDKAIFLGKVAAYDDVLVTLIADVASAYVKIRTLEERIRVVQGNIEIEKESLRIATARVKAGELTERDVQMAAAQLAATEAGLPQMQEVMRQVKNGLAVLLGQTPESVDKYLVGESRIPVTVPTIAAGIPKDLLRRRPDVRAAGYAAAAKSALIGVAKANMYPSFSLSGSFGISSGQAGSSLSVFYWG
jgi:NodT family efflux transporter outer membrane factor (OMF) lipoprotein